jgi:hypothetical protein
VEEGSGSGLYSMVGTGISNVKHWCSRATVTHIRAYVPHGIRIF